MEFDKNIELDQFVQKSQAMYRYKLLYFMLITGFFISLFYTIIRYSQNNLVAAEIDLVLTLSFAIGIYYLKKDKKLLDTIASIQLTVAFLLFCLISVALEADHVKLLWFSLAITVTFMLKGIKAGLGMYVATLVVLPLFYLLPMVDLHLTLREVIMAELFYTIMTLYNLFSTLEQQKSMKSIQEASSQIKQQQIQLYKQLRTDHISQLPNALALRERLATEVKPCALISLKIDDFIELSNIFGHDKAIHIVEKSAQMLQHFVSTTTSLYHTELAEFSFFIANANEDEAQKVAHSIKVFFENRHLNVDNLEISISFSMGIAQGKSEKLIVQANSALQECIAEGANNYKVYEKNPQREEDQKNNLYWNSKIKEVIHEGKLRVYYQPIIDNKTQEVVKYECLIRALDGDKIIPPFFFLQAAKSRGMLPAITKVVIEESFKVFADNEISFSINITDDDLKDNYLVNFLLQKSKEYGIKPERVYLEVLESITSAKAQHTSTQFEALKRLGFQISIDDFGAEASNLSRLLTLQADIIKIDGQFIKNLDSDANSIKIVETVVSLAQKIGAKTVAEFVHNEEIFHIVQRLGVDYSQGYYFSPPLPQIQEIAIVAEV
jgi:EAL domain-containing protein (putative c-di-GMP-specific phosphodiesterase class I)/GGDEF domain-containing protein